MAQLSRVVERLRLRAGSESALRRAVPRLEDAFRIASLPDVGARVVVVRRLALGRLPADASAQTLSQILESRFTEAGCQPVHASHGQTDSADVVWFRDPLEAHQLAALRVAAGHSVDAWFWPHAVPALARPVPGASALRVLAFSLAARDDAPAALPAWVDALVQAGHEERLIAALNPGDGTALMQAAAIPEIARAATPNGTRVPVTATMTATNGGRASSAGGQSVDDRRACVERLTRRATARLISRPTMRPTVVAPASQPSPVHRGALTESAPADPPRAYGSPVAWPAGAVPAVAPTPEAPDTRLRPEPEGDRIEPLSTPDRTSASRRQLTAAQVANPDAPESSRLSTGAVPTAAGGLLLLVSALEHLGFGHWSRETTAEQMLAPDAPARHLFHTLLSRLPLADEDPSWQLGAPLEEPSHVVRTTASWLATCRGLLRRRVGLGLASLVLRPAHVAMTDTHADVFFGLNAADVRIRRAGLDVDPGWVPWLGKVVTFHYGERPWT